MKLNCSYMAVLFIVAIIPIDFQMTNMACHTLWPALVSSLSRNMVSESQYDSTLLMEQAGLMNPTVDSYSLYFPSCH